MLQRSSSRDHDTSSTPRPTYFSDKQTSDYLASLRNNRISRPNGSRPPPASRKSTLRDSDSNGRRSSSSGSNELTHSRSSSVLSYYRGAGSASSGRSSPEKMFAPPQRTSEERAHEKQEAHAIRIALEQMDEVDEQGLHLAAQEEAAGLVWHHQNPDAPYPLRPKKQVILREEQVEVNVKPEKQLSDVQATPGTEDPKGFTEGQAQLPLPDRSPSKRLREKMSFSRLASRRRSSASKRVMSGSPRKVSFPNAEEKIWEDKPKDEEKPIVTTKETAIPTHVRRNPFARAHSARQVQQLVQEKPRTPYRTEIQRNPPSQSRDPTYTQNEPLLTETPEKTTVEEPAVQPDMPETRFKDGIEVRSDDIRAATSMRMRDRSPKLPSPTVVSNSPGRPIVSFNADWQPPEKEQNSAPKDTRTMPSRPSASPLRGFAPAQIASAPVIPTFNHPNIPVTQLNAASAEDSTRPPIPQICLPDDPVQVQDIPSISIEESPSTDLPTPASSAPSIQVSTAPDSDTSTPTLAIKYQGPVSHKHSDSNRGRAQPRRTPLRHADTAPIPTTRGHWTPASHRNGTANAALCAQCALPISGRIVTAAGTRFHPSCFSCHHCGEGLECVAFYPEPAQSRESRLERIQARLACEEVEPPDGHSMDDDNDDALRFYCHLDFHEFFSPRCKSCKTPIEGEVIVACGAEWHVGHFFCAQCGDPFDPSIPFVEKEGYAWCVNCHTNRTSTRCKKCKKPVTDMVLKALGAEWHEGCFRCMECDGGFDDGRYFIRGESQDPVCSACEARRLKA